MGCWGAGVLGCGGYRIRQEHLFRPSSHGSACQGQYPATGCVQHRSPQKGIRALVLRTWVLEEETSGSCVEERLELSGQGK